MGGLRCIPYQFFSVRTLKIAGSKERFSLHYSGYHGTFSLIFNLQFVPNGKQGFDTILVKFIIKQRTMV